MWTRLRHAEDVPILVSHAVPDGPWADWIAGELRAAGYTADVRVARSDFVDRILAAFSGSDPVLVLVSAEHPGTAADWIRLAEGCRSMIVLWLDAGAPPVTVAGRAHRLDGLTADEIRELLLGLIGGPPRHPIG
jgi:hypothetical protein